MKGNRDSLDFGKEPVGRLFRKMFLPTLVGMIAMVVLNITDGAFVGHGVGSDALAAVNIVAPLFLVMTGIGLLFGIGSSVVASIHLSKGNGHAANINMTQGLLVSFISGLVVGIVLLLFLEQTCRLCGCSDALLPLAASYLRWIAIGMPLTTFGVTAAFMVRLDGSPRFAMVVSSCNAILNIVLDYLFIFRFKMGLEGAALATSMAFSLGCIAPAVYLWRYTVNIHLCRLKLTATSMRLTLRNIAYQIRIGFSALLGELAIAAIIIVGNYFFMQYLGEDGVAAYSVGCYCLPIVFMLGNAIVQSVQPIVSFAYGAQNSRRLQTAKTMALRTSVVFGVVGMLFMALGANVISSVFLPMDCRAYTLCCEGLPYFSPAFIIVAVNIVIIGYLQSMEKAGAATVFTMLRGFVFSVPCFFLLPKLIGVPGLWLALPAAELLTLIVILSVKRF